VPTAPRVLPVHDSRQASELDKFHLADAGGGAQAAQQIDECTRIVNFVFA
jgi:hypothetical protein